MFKFVMGTKIAYMCMAFRLSKNGKNSVLGRDKKFLGGACSKTSNNFDIFLNLKGKVREVR